MDENFRDLSDDDFEAQLLAADNEVTNDGQSDTTNPESIGSDPSSLTNTLPPGTETPEAQSQERRQGDLNVALRQERERRRQLEERVQQYETWYATQVQQQTRQPEPEPPDPILEPEAYFQWQFEKSVKPTIDQIQHESEISRVSWSAELARMKHTDYDDVIDAHNPDGQLNQYLQRNPQAWDQIKRSANPAETAYNLAKDLQLADPARMQQTVEAKAKVLAEQMLKEALAKGTPAPKAPSSIAHIGSGSNANVELDWRKMNDEQFEDYLRDE
jgi:hypothetical protein